MTEVLGALMLPIVWMIVACIAIGGLVYAGIIITDGIKEL